MDPQSSQQPINPQASPSYRTNYNTPSTDVNVTPPPPQRGNKLLLKIGIVIVALILLLGTAIIMYAYNVFSFGDKSFQESVSDFVQGMPFMPKTPTFVLKASAKAHQKVTRFTVDASVALSSTGLGPLTGLNNFDIEVKGPIDYKDPKNPILSLNVSAKEFSLDLKRKDYILYFRINEIPTLFSLLLTNFGIDETLQKQFIDKWFFIDTKPFETEARRSLEKQNTTRSIFDTLDDSKAMKFLTMSNDRLATASFYHIHFAPTDDILDKLWKNQYNSEDSKISKTITRFVMDSWIDKKDYYVSKIAVTFTIKAQPPPQNRSSPLPNVLPNQAADIPVSFVVNLSDFGKEVPFIIPENPVKFDEFLKYIMPKVQKAATPSGSLYTKQSAMAKNTKRKSDVNTILVALNQYSEDHAGVIPPQITYTSREISSNGADLCNIIVPTYLAALPVDPSINEGTPIAACAITYNTGYLIQRSGAGITVSAPNAENGETILVTR